MISRTTICNKLQGTAFTKGTKISLPRKMNYLNEHTRVPQSLKGDREARGISVEVIVSVGNQFQVVVQAQGAYEQTRASGIVERRGTSQVHTRDVGEAAHAKSTMEREVSFVSNPVYPSGTSILLSFLLFLLPSLCRFFCSPGKRSETRYVKFHIGSA